MFLTLVLSQVDPSVPPPSNLNWWQQLLYMLVVVGIFPFVMAWLRNAAAASAAKRDQYRSEAVNNSQQTLTTIRYELESFLLEQAAAIAEREYGNIAQDVLAGKLKTAEDVKARLVQLGKGLRDDAIRAFAQRGINLVDLYGASILDKLIEAAVNRISPFPGMETSVELLKEQVSKSLIENGVRYMRQWYLQRWPDSGVREINS